MTINTSLQSKKKSYYVDNKYLTKTLIEYVKQKKDDETLTLRQFELGDYIGKSIIDICTNLGHKTNFIGYTYKEEMVDDAIEACVKAAGNFNGELSSNAFGYFTQVAFNAFVRRIKIEAKHREKLLRVLSDDEQINDIINRQFDENSDSSIDAQSFVSSIHSLLSENEQLIEFVEILPHKRRKKDVVSVFDEFLED